MKKNKQKPRRTEDRKAKIEARIQTEKRLAREENLGAADSFMEIFGYQRIKETNEPNDLRQSNQGPGGRPCQRP